MRLQQKIYEEVIQRLGDVSLTARQAVESILAGQHRSIRRGLSVEFAGHRAYLPGDDLRHLDWFVYARSDRFDVRLYEEETRLRATVVLDASGSMQYGAGAVTKLEYARSLAAALAFIMVRQADSVGLAVCDTQVREHLPASSTMGHLVALLDRLEKLKPGGETSLAAVLTQVAARITRRGVVILITDAFDDAGQVLNALHYLRHRKQELQIFQILDRTEESFPFHGMVEFLGLEDEPGLKLDGDRIHALYQQAFAGHQQQLAEGCHALGATLHVCRTDEDLAATLARALHV